MPAGGTGGNSRSDALLDVAESERRWVADFVVVRRGSGPGTLSTDLERIRQTLLDAQLGFPLVVKPDIGWRGRGVRRIDDVSALREYLRVFPGGARRICNALCRTVATPRCCMRDGRGPNEGAFSRWPSARIQMSSVTDMPVWVSSSATIRAHAAIPNTV